MGYGRCAILYVGGVFDRCELLTVGSALTDALKSEGCSSSGGEVIVASSAFMYVREYFKATEIVNQDGDTFHKIDLTFIPAKKAKTKADGIRLVAQITEAELIKIQHRMQGFVPRCVIPYLAIEQEAYASDNRTLTVMFVSLGVDLSSADTPEGIQKIQNVMVEV